MTISRCVSNVCVSLYKAINRTGLLNLTLAQRAFISSYFAYKKYIEDPYAKLVKKHPEFFSAGHILDIGANIGYTSYIFSKALTSPYQIFAFEPEARNRRILKLAANKYHFANQIVTVAAAVGDKEGEIELWQNDGHHADHRVLTDELRKQLKGKIHIQKIPLVTIDHFLKKQNALQPVSFIKIDVQGYELAVCHGMDETLECNPNCVVGFEYCPSIMNSLGYRIEDLIEYFLNKQFLFYRLNKNGSLDLLDMGLLRDSKEYYFDIICSRNSLC